MKKILSILALVLSTIMSFSQTNISFAKAVGLSEAVSVTCEYEAYTRFIEAAENPILGPAMAERISQAYQRAGKLYNGRQTMSAKDVVTILKWLRVHPEESAKYFISVYQMPEGISMTYETAAHMGSAKSGKNVSRSVYQNEWSLEAVKEDIMSSWCLNFRPTTGKVTDDGDNGNVEKPGTISFVPVKTTKPPVEKRDTIRHITHVFDTVRNVYVENIHEKNVVVDNESSYNDSYYTPRPVVRYVRPQPVVRISFCWSCGHRHTGVCSTYYKPVVRITVCWSCGRRHTGACRPVSGPAHIAQHGDYILSGHRHQ